MEDISKYEDIINMPHHVSKKHPHMSILDRAAQFAPYAALTGHKDLIDETARLTDRKIDLNEEEKKILNYKLKIILDQIDLKPMVKITYFMKDNRKDGGCYLSITGIVKRIDDFKKVIILDDNSKISIDDVLDIESSIINM